MRQSHLMWQTTAVAVCWQQGQEEGGEEVERVWILWRMICPAHTGDEVSCGVGGVVQ